MRQVYLLVALLILIASAYITIDIGPIPVSAQSLAVLLVGYLQGVIPGTLAVLLYLVCGAVGLPVFADGASGIQVLAGGSAGFLWGFVPAAFLLGRLRHLGWGQYFHKALLAMLLGTALIVVCGVFRLSLLYGVGKALEYGFYPFIWGALIKIVVGAVVIYLFERRALKT